MRKTNFFSVAAPSDFKKVTGEAEATHPDAALGCDPSASPSDVE